MSEAVRNRVVLIHGAGNGTPTPHDGRYVVAWNPHTEYGVLELDSTADIARARRFAADEAMREWRATSSKAPLRPDGKPNRPLTGLTIVIVDAERIAE